VDCCPGHVRCADPVRHRRRLVVLGDFPSWYQGRPRTLEDYCLGPVGPVTHRYRLVARAGFPSWCRGRPRSPADSCLGPWTARATVHCPGRGRRSPLPRSTLWCAYLPYCGPPSHYALRGPIPPWPPAVTCPLLRGRYTAAAAPPARERAGAVGALDFFVLCSKIHATPSATARVPCGMRIGQRLAEHTVAGTCALHGLGLTTASLR
jgi:hypothetical protein